jgi:hypothetical protein
VVEVPLLSNDLPVAVEGVEDSHALCDRDAAGLPTHRPLDQYEEPVSEVDQLLGLKTNLTPGAEPVGLEFAVALVTAVGRLKPKLALLADPWRLLKLHIWVIAEDDHVKVSPVGGLEASLYRSQQERLPQTGGGRKPRHQLQPQLREPGHPNGQSLLERPSRRLSQRNLLAHHLNVLLRHPAQYPV